MLALGIYLGKRESYIGIDTDTYLKVYSMENYKFNEIFYNYYMSLLRYLKISSENYILITALIYSIILGIAIYKYLTNKKVFLLVIWGIFLTPVYLFNAINILRQGLAGAFLLLGLAYLKENRKKIALFIGGGSVFFHSSVVIYFLIFFKKLRECYNKFSLASLISGTGILIVILYNLVGLNSKVSGYEGREQSNLFYIKVLILLLFYIINFLKKNNSIEMLIFYITFIFVIATIKSPKLSNRYFYIVEYYYFIILLDNKKINKLVLVIIFLYQIYFLNSSAFIKNFNLIS